ncbi:AAA family ATPase [Corynebacterium casei]|uniref:AAA family ATPase n=1 Tax=Corynebacterium casei TaxID=160386 RepID=UPI003FD02024
MKIHSIELTDFRGVKYLKVNDIPDTGVTIIHGRNEAGKTTILKGIDALFNYKFSSKATAVKALQTVNADVSPQAAMEFSVGPYRLKLSKQWIKQASALLEVLEPSLNTYKGEEAETQLNEILSRHLDRNLFDAMFLNQDDLHEGIKAAGISSVAGVLSNQTGEEAVLGEDAEAATELMKQVDATYERYYSLKTGIEAKELKAARAEHTAASDELESASEALAALAEYVERFEKAQEQQRAADEKIPGARKEVEEAEQQLKEIEGLQSTVNGLLKDQEVARQGLELAQARRDERAKLRESLDAAVKESKKINEAVESAETKAKEEEQEVAGLNAEVESAKKLYTQARERSKQARISLAGLQKKRQAHELISKSAQVEEHAEKLSAVRSEVEKFGPAVVDRDLQRVEKLEQELELNRRLREAAVAKLVLTSATSQQISVNGEELDVGASGQNVELTPGLTLNIGDVTARYEPGTGADSAQELDRKITATTEELELELEKLDCTDVDAVRAKRDKYRELLQQREQHEAELKRILDGEDLEELRARAAAVEEIDEVPDSAAIEKAELEISEAEEAEENANNAVEKAEAKLKPWAERPARNALIKIQSEAEQANKQIERLDHELKVLKETTSDEALEQQALDAETALGKVNEDVAQAREKLEAAKPDLAQSLARGARAQLDNLQAKHRNAENEQISMTGHIQMQSGVAERVEKAEAAEELARNILQAVEQRALAVKRLREVLLGHQREARERYAAPFAQKLGQLAGRVFNGEVQFHLSDDLVVEKRTLDGVTVGMQDLSGGAREQMAILTRFAIAELLSTSGEQGAPVVVDDALGSTDASRIQLMATLFADVGEKSQVIVFTCEPARYDRVPDSTFLDIDQLKSAAPIG